MTKPFTLKLQKMESKENRLQCLIAVHNSPNEEIPRELSLVLRALDGDFNQHVPLVFDEAEQGYTTVQKAGFCVPDMSNRYRMSVIWGEQEHSVCAEAGTILRLRQGKTLVQVTAPSPPNDRSENLIPVLIQSYLVADLQSSPHSIFSVDIFAVEEQRLYIRGRFAPLGTIIKHWGQASYLLVLENDQRTICFGLGLDHRPDENLLPLSLCKSYFSDIHRKGIDLSGIPEGFYTASIVIINQDVALSSGIFGSLCVSTISDNRPPKVSILGSCIIRDIFNSRFVPDWKSRSEVSSESFQQSIVSITSTPYSGEKLDLSDLDGLAIRYTRADLEKTYLQDLQNTNPDWVLIDLFSDARFGVIETAPGEYITDNTWKIGQSASYQKLDQKSVISMKNNPDKYIELFRESLTTLKKILSSKKNPVNFAYVKVDAASYTRDRLGQVEEKISIADGLNETFAKLEKVLLEVIPDIEVLDLRGYTKWGNKDHPWSSYVVHYEQDFYDALDAKLRKIFELPRQVKIISGEVSST
ncbi:DUF6270 domain-containing protein [Rothia sp. P7208]|uniref:DUF6270 domain-containing protein n=1 Tax=Rothia sp. P7208 TaxID=3402660 RepID=UPI003ACC7D19